MYGWVVHCHSDSNIRGPDDLVSIVYMLYVDSGCLAVLHGCRCLSWSGAALLLVVYFVACRMRSEHALSRKQLGHLYSSSVHMQLLHCCRSEHRLSVLAPQPSCSSRGSCWLSSALPTLHQLQHVWQLICTFVLKTEYNLLMNLKVSRCWGAVGVWPG
jgi:hypothetical protein